MSPDMERLIGRSVVDKDFRDRLLADPEGTVKGAGLSITADELDTVKRAAGNLTQSLTPDQIDASFGVQHKGTWA